jgi:hypothetical protein
MNANQMLTDLRDNVNEATGSHWDDVDLLRKLNQANRAVGTHLINTNGEWLTESALFTPSASVITLTNVVGRIVYMEEASTGREISLSGNVRDRRETRLTGSTLWTGAPEAYLLGNTIEINQDAYNNQVRLWYVKRVLNLSQGTAGSGTGASALELDSTMEPSLEDDYYNSQTVEITTATGADIRSTISDYDFATRVCTITGTPVNGDTYGTVSVIPEEGHALIVLKATLTALSKPSSAIDPKYYTFFRTQYKDELTDFDNWAATRLSGHNHVRITEIY